jgi:hypothetical protein
LRRRYTAVAHTRHQDDLTTRARYICRSHVDTPVRITPFPLALSAGAAEFEAIDDSFRKTVESKLDLQNKWIRARSLLCVLYLKFALVDVAHQQLVITMPCSGTDLVPSWHTFFGACSYISEMTPAMPATELLYLSKVSLRLKSAPQIHLWGRSALCVCQKSA